MTSGQQTEYPRSQCGRFQLIDRRRETDWLRFVVRDSAPTRDGREKFNVFHENGNFRSLSGEGFGAQTWEILKTYLSRFLDDSPEPE